jgi:muramoyltetrapeptide carboxypeptidase
VKVAIVAPACRLKPETAEAIRALAASLLCADAPALDFHPQCFLSDGHFAGPDRARAAALLEAANDPAFDAVWFARGGYGSCRLLELVEGRFSAAARSKTYLGYSDCGSLLGLLYRDGVGSPVHGPMPADINRPGGSEAVARALRWLARRDPEAVDPAARGRRVAAFNLTILLHLLATPFAPDLAGHVVMVEEVAEHHYRIDRALCAVVSNAKIRKAAGLMLGRASDIPDNDPPYLRSEEEIARHWCECSGVPWLGRADIGHDIANKVVPFGPRYAA